MKFGRLTDLINNVKKLDQNKILVKVLNNKDITDFIIKLNTVDQLFEGGVGRDGTIIPRYSSKDYVDIFKGKTQTAGSPDVGLSSGEKVLGEQWNLVATGEMFDSFTVIIDGGGFSISADTLKVGDDGDRVDYNEEYKIIGLNDESKTKLAQKMLPMVIEEVKRILLS